MKKFRKIVQMLTAGAVSWSCLPADFSVPCANCRGEAGGGDPGSLFQEDSISEVPQVRPGEVYITAVEYPAGYDWEEDPEHGSVDCRLFMLKDGKKLSGIPVGDRYEVSSDPRRHRCIDGHLYTDYASSSETVVKKDGEELFRYPAPELFLSFHVSKGDVYTLGTGAGGGPGFVFRKNGEVCSEYPDAFPLSGIHEDGDNICFSYWRYSSPVFSGPDDPRDFHLFCGGRDIILCDKWNVLDVLAAEMIGGEIYRVVEVADKKYMLSVGDAYYPMDISGYHHLASCSFMRGSTEVFVYGELTDYNGKEAAPVVWTREGVVASFGEYKISFFTFADGDTVYSFIGYNERYPSITSYAGGEKLFSYGRALAVTARPAAVVSGGKLYFAFTDRDMPRKPYLAEDGVITEYEFNGFFSSVTLW